MTDKHIERAHRLLDEALDSDCSDPWWRVDEAQDEIEKSEAFNGGR